MQKTEERGTAAGLVVGGVGGATLATVIAVLLAARPARAAPTDEKLDYLIEVLTTLVPVLAQVAEGQAELITAMQQWLAAQGIPVAPAAEGVEVTVSTPWIAKEPEQIFSSAIRSAGTFYSDKMVDWNRGKRIVFKVESSLNQAVNIQLIGNIVDSKELATDIGLALPCTANGNISVGPAWDDWTPFIGIRITAAVAPTAGILTIWAVIQS
ncbi:unnamed protein product [marine sediment metagenome]|uniref:Uncharacterized protein n=1 Tax=marine sediment metagenome TaxID=412755 RepID=X1PZ51_9ZZZZ